MVDTHEVIQFEAVKISMNETGHGLIFKMAVHPDDAPQRLIESFNGSRYQVVMVKINDDEQPEDEFVQREIERLKSSCGALCRNPKFQQWLLRNLNLDINEENAVCVLRQHLGITSRAEFSTNTQARLLFIQMREDFQTWLKNSMRI
jgi:hypothetical protein